MQVGDLIVDREGQLGIVLTEPRLSADCDEYGEAWEEEYYLIDVQFPRYVECLATDEVEIISYAQR